MITRKTLNTAVALLSVSAHCHMELLYPPPLRSRYNPYDSYLNIDYSMTSPLEADGSDFPCKGYQNDRPIQTVVTYTAGSTYNMSLAGSATHGGGSCQLSLSYDNGATFRVIKSMIGGCPLTTTYDFTIPSSAPTGTALFAWTWQNLIGNREYYMNCAEVNIVSGSRRRQRRQSFSSFNELPYIWKGNLAGINDCVTVENVNVVYPEPGPDVIYGADVTGASPATLGDCDAPTPYGRTYENLGDTDPPPFPESSTTQTSATATSPAQTGAQLAMYISATTQPGTTSPRQSAMTFESYSTTTVTVDCQTTVTLTTMPSFYMTAAACSGTSASCPCAVNYQCQELSPCIWGCEAHSTMGAMSHHSGPTGAHTTMSALFHISSHTGQPAPHSTRFVTTTHTVSPARSSHSPPPPPPSGSSHGHPPYAGSNVNRYLPCVPGTFICIDRTTWDTCDYNASGQWVYEYPRPVAAGMECITSLSRYSSGTSHHGQQGSTPQGFYRDDHIVRARPDGDCSTNGAIKCTNGGKSFEICDQGGWVTMGGVAAGTSCRNGHIV